MSVNNDLIMNITLGIIKKKRIISLIFCLIILVSLSACSSPINEEYYCDVYCDGNPVELSDNILSCSNYDNSSSVKGGASIGSLNIHCV